MNILKRHNITQVNEWCHIRFTRESYLVNKHFRVDFDITDSGDCVGDLEVNPSVKEYQLQRDFMPLQNMAREYSWLFDTNNPPVSKLEMALNKK
jgi:hypothetical protein